MSSTPVYYHLLVFILFTINRPTFSATVFGQDAAPRELIVPVSSPPAVRAQDATSQILSDLPDQKECGINNRATGSVGSTPSRTTIKDWPWQAAVLRKADLFQFCGGAVITRRHILSAAHCLPGVHPSKILIRLGEYDFKRLDDTKHIDIDVAEIRSHDLYDPVNYHHDIAIIKLLSPVSFGTYIQPICLPPPGPRYTNTTAIVIGWGTLFYGGPKSDVLMEVSVPVWEQKTCQACFLQQIFDTNLCAAGYQGGKDSCQGDSGGPLLQERADGKWEEIGIVSWGIRCAEKNKPGIYTRVNDYLSWITERSKDI